MQTFTANQRMFINVRNVTLNQLNYQQ